jgi:hypothetical protein
MMEAGSVINRIYQCKNVIQTVRNHRKKRGLKQKRGHSGKQPKLLSGKNLYEVIFVRISKIGFMPIGKQNLSLSAVTENMIQIDQI